MVVGVASAGASHNDRYVAQSVTSKLDGDRCTPADRYLDFGASLGVSDPRSVSKDGG
jgi:hypothetical protein